MSTQKGRSEGWSEGDFERASAFRLPCASALPGAVAPPQLSAGLTRARTTGPSAPTLASLWRCCRLGKADVSRCAGRRLQCAGRGGACVQGRWSAGPRCPVGLASGSRCHRSATCWSCRVLTLLPPGARESQASDGQTCNVRVPPELQGARAAVTWEPPLTGQEAQAVKACGARA